MIFISRCGAVGSNLDFAITYVNDALGGVSPPTAEIYPSQVGVAFGPTTWNAMGTVRGARMQLQLGKQIGGLFNILTSTPIFTVTPLLDGSGLAEIRDVQSPFSIIDRLYLSFVWTNCQNAPPYAFRAAYAGSPQNAPFGMTYVFNLTPLLDRVTPCSN